MEVRIGYGQLQQVIGAADDLAGRRPGDFDLALARYSEASGTFAVAHEHYVAANAPGLALLVEGYMALVREMANEVSSEKDSLDQICAKISTGGFKDGVAWIAQLRTAREAILAARRKASGDKT